MNSILVSKLKCFKRVSSLIASAAKHLESLGYRQGTIGNHAYPVDFTKRDKTWRENHVTSGQVMHRMQPVLDGTPVLGGLLKY
ncbi:MAG: hypothetical protein SRB2_02945 [Desulfobacteraceae bacterium Eth-SRB2]|nr:MAG: hypothetical protein SRB2_02945 [Desulfobacteraceae bacterium Eth-SRB2]